MNDTHFQCIDCDKWYPTEKRAHYSTNLCDDCTDNPGFYSSFGGNE